MPHSEGILYIDCPPVTSIDATGVVLVVGSGNFAYRVRYDRAVWRRVLESELSKINNYELAERADRGRLVPFKNQ